MTFDIKELGRVRQIALVVEDLEESIHAYADLLGVGPWSAYELSSDFLQDMTYEGNPAEFSFLHALAWSGETQLELVQPLRGPSIFADHLSEHGPGLHHVGIVVEDHAGWVQRFKDAGHQALQSARGFGADGTGAFCYFDLGHPVAGIVELISPPTVRREPLYVYPQGEV